MGIPAPTYIAHEGDSKKPSRENAIRYARFFRVDLEWLLNGNGELRPARLSVVPLVGYVGPGSEVIFAHQTQSEPPGEAVMPPGGSNFDLIALEVRGEAMPGVADDGAVIYFRDDRLPPTEELLGKLCICGLDDGRILVKRLQRGRDPGRFDLYSGIGAPLLDAPVTWAALVQWINHNSPLRLAALTGHLAILNI